VRGQIYCGQLGKQDNCQLAVSLSLANHHASLPVAYQLYLPQDWADDRERRHKAGVPDRCRRRSGSQGGASREHGCAATLQPLEIAPQNRQPQAPIRAIFGNSLS
jgi:DDE superfamily endonuclease